MVFRQNGFGQKLLKGRKKRRTKKKGLSWVREGVVSHPRIGKKKEEGVVIKNNILNKKKKKKKENQKKKKKEKKKK